MEPKLGATLGGKFLKEVRRFEFLIILSANDIRNEFHFFQVKRVLKHGGKYICLTLVEFNVLSKILFFLEEILSKNYIII